LSEIAADYYIWSKANPQKNRKEYPRFSEAKNIGIELYEKGAKKAMLSAYEEAKTINPSQVWIISKIWDGIGNTDSGEMDDVWID
jgi:hypothetical protein